MVFMIILLFLTLHTTFAFYGEVNENIFFDSSIQYIFARHSKKSIDCSQGSGAVQQYGFHGRDNQQFKIEYKEREWQYSDDGTTNGLVDEDGNKFYWYWYHIRCKDDNDLWTRGSSAWDVDDIDHEPSCSSSDGKNCRFRFDYLEQPALFQIINKRDHKCLDVQCCSHDDKKRLQAYDCHSGNNQKFIIIPKQEYKCPFTVNSIYKRGEYYNALNLPSVATGQYKVYNYRTMEIRKIQVWGGSMQDSDPAANAHGRIHPSTSRRRHDWEAGDVLTFTDRSGISCASSSITVTCPFAVLDTIHNGNRKHGGYFRFDIDQVNEILGYSLSATNYFKIRNLRDNTVRNVIMWPDNNGGTIIKDSYGIARRIGHGRINPMPSNYDYWKVGDVLMFEGRTTKCIQKFVSNYDVNPLPSPINDEPIENIIKDHKYIFGSITSLFIVMFICLVYFWYKQCCTFRKKPKYEPVKIIDSESEAEMVEINK